MKRAVEKAKLPTPTAAKEPATLSAGRIVGLTPADLDKLVAESWLFKETMKRCERSRKTRAWMSKEEEDRCNECLTCLVRGHFTASNHQLAIAMTEWDYVLNEVEKRGGPKETLAPQGKFHVYNPCVRRENPTSRQALN
jgi:hypothetical protein